MEVFLDNCHPAAARRAQGGRTARVRCVRRMLLEPESSVVHRHLKPSVVQMFFERAKDIIHTIDAIRKPPVRSEPLTDPVVRTDPAKISTTLKEAAVDAL